MQIEREDDSSFLLKEEIKIVKLLEENGLLDAGLGNLNILLVSLSFSISERSLLVPILVNNAIEELIESKWLSNSCAFQSSAAMSSSGLSGGIVLNVEAEDRQFT